MSELRLETMILPAAPLGDENPLPPFGTTKDQHTFSGTDGVPDEILMNLNYGRVQSILPYTLQDNYTRERTPRPFKVAVLENETLRATFLLELGGRLWSLYNKVAQRELLAVNPVFQPANLALRNAWFSGGVEWNIGTIGHSPLTCSPLFAARVVSGVGYPVLRMYEWERMRQVPFQIDAFLPDHSEMLYIYVRIINPHHETIPMYWWSNTAVPETPNTRVIVPAEKAYRFGYDTTLRSVPVPILGGEDISYPYHRKQAMDFFFHIPDSQRHWICAMDEKGQGLVQTSTRRLQGRKLFLWGTAHGGQQWQHFLTGEGGQPYLEIQAGLARTQLEHLRMPANTEWSWLEAYGLLNAEAKVVHGADWTSACQHVADRLDQLLPAQQLAVLEQQCKQTQDMLPVEQLHLGSGWGYLEHRRRVLAGEAPFCSNALPFPESSLHVVQTLWLQLLEHGHFLLDDANRATTFMIQDEWMGLLRTSLSGMNKDNALAWLHYGIMLFHEDRNAEAKHAFQRSLVLQPSHLSLRNLALIARHEGDMENARLYYLEAHRQAPELQPLIIEIGNFLVDFQLAQEWLNLLNTLSRQLRQNGRIRLLEAAAGLQVGDLYLVERFFADGVVIPDLREGETRLSDMWFSYHEALIRLTEHLADEVDVSQRAALENPLPKAFDFRMKI